MRKYIAVAGLVLLTRPSFGQPVCRLSDGVFVSDQSRVYLNFVAHRSNREIDILNAILEHPEQLDNKTLAMLENFYSKLEGIMHLDEQAKDAVRLQNLLNQKKISWIGVEFSPSEVSLRDSQGKGVAVYFKRLRLTLSNAGASPALIEKSLLLYAGSPARYVYLKNREAGGQLSLVPLDSDDLKQRGIQLLDDTTMNEELISGLAKIRPQTAAESTRVIDKLNELSKDWTELSDSEITAFANTIRDTDLSSFTVTALKKQREFNRNQKARDIYAAGIVLAQNGTGWISEGTAHRHLADRLVERCQAGGATSAVPNTAGAAQ